MIRYIHVYPAAGHHTLREGTECDCDPGVEHDENDTLVVHRSDTLTTAVVWARLRGPGAAEALDEMGWAVMVIESADA